MNTRECKICLEPLSGSVNCVRCGYTNNDLVSEEIAYKHKLTEIYHTFILYKRYDAALIYITVIVLVLSSALMTVTNHAEAFFLAISALLYMLANWFFAKKNYRKRYASIALLYLVQCLLEIGFNCYPFRFLDQLITSSGDIDIDIIVGLVKVLYWSLRFTLAVFLFRVWWLAVALERDHKLFAYTLFRFSHDLHNLPKVR